MKKIFLAILLGSCICAKAQTTEKVVSKHMEYLASDDRNGRDVGTKGIQEAADYIEDYFKKNGVTPYFKYYKDTLSTIKTPAYNIVGVVPGNDKVLKNEYIVLGAHYDHIGISKEVVAGDSIANGANDNASGTTAVLELAKYFGKHKTNKRSILFVLFSAEEKGLLGSEHLADKLSAQGFNLYCMVNFEMIGVPMKTGDLSYVTGYDMSNMAAKLNEMAGSEVVSFLETAKKYNLFQRSDNYPFYAAFKVPAQTICTFDFTNFDHYHMVGDEVEKMDFKHMVNFINTFIPVIEKLSNTKEQVVKMN